MKVSVLINNYNNAPYMAECLESVFQQETSCEVEVIVYDDGSTDDSLAVIRRFPVTQVLHDVNYGKTPQLNQAHAIQEAFRVSTGELVFLLDGDDYFLPGKIETVVRLYRQDYFDVLAHSYEPGRPRIPDVSLEDIAYTFNFGFKAVTSCLVISRSFMETMLPVDERFELTWFDNRVHLQSIIRGRRRIIQEPLTYYRQHPQSYMVTQKFIRRKRLVWQSNRYFNTYSPLKTNYWKVIAFKLSPFTKY